MWRSTEARRGSSFHLLVYPSASFTSARCAASASQRHAGFSASVVASVIVRIVLSLRNHEPYRSSEQSVHRIRHTGQTQRSTDTHLLEMDQAGYYQEGHRKGYH